MYSSKFRLTAVGLAVACIVIPSGLGAAPGGWSFFSKFHTQSDVRGKAVEGNTGSETQKPAAAEEKQTSGSETQKPAVVQENSTGAAEERTSCLATIGDALLWYIPNRICDLVDCFSVEIGAGPNIKADLYLTRACALGAGYGDSYLLGWSHRFFGGEKRLGKYASTFGYDGNFIFLGSESCSYRNWFGNFPDFEVDRNGVIDIDSEEYTSGNTDFWAIGIDVGLLGNVKVMLHPVSLCDFITGLVFIDLEGDDHTSREK